jgi:hypothetical protein
MCPCFVFLPLGTHQSLHAHSYINITTPYATCNTIKKLSSSISLRFLLIAFLFGLVVITTVQVSIFYSGDTLHLIFWIIKYLYVWDFSYSVSFLLYTWLVYYSIMICFLIASLFCTFLYFWYDTKIAFVKI